MIDIVLCADNNYAMPAGVMVYSVCKHTPGVKFYMIVSKDFTQVNKNKLLSITERFGAAIEFIPIPDNLVKDLPIGKEGQALHITIASYYRLFLTKLLPDTVHKVIYLDCDIIVLQTLKDLWNTNLDSIPMAGVLDVPYDGISEANRLGYDEKFGYYNAGVLLINIDYWRMADSINDFQRIISENYDNLKSHDQDVLNYAFMGKVLTIPPKYNAVDLMFYNQLPKHPYSAIEAHEAIHNPVIVHFSYIKKPWIKGYGHTYEKKFLEYKKATPWRFSPLKIAKADSVKGFFSNLFVFLGLHTYSNDYVRL